MKMYHEDFELTQDLMDAIVVFMDDEIREKYIVRLHHVRQPIFLKLMLKKIRILKIFCILNFLLNCKNL